MGDLQFWAPWSRPISEIATRDRSEIHGKLGYPGEIRVRGDIAGMKKVEPASK